MTSSGTADGWPEGAPGRAERAATLSGWCGDHAVPWQGVDLSDLAAMLVAAGRTDPVTRRTVLARARAGAGLPIVGDYTGLRRDADHLQRMEAASRSPGGRARTIVYAGRAESVRRRMQALRSSVVTGLVVHPGGVRGVRRERREGVHLTLEQRENLFTLLCWTPAPLAAYRGGRAVEAGQAVVADVAAMFSERAGLSGLSGLADKSAHSVRRASAPADFPYGRGDAPGALGRVQRWARGRSGVREDAHGAGGPDEPGDAGGGEDGRRNGPEPLRFRDAYETAVYLAGRYVDGIRGSRVWNSDSFAPYRVRIDLFDELVRFARDAAELQSLGGELAAARASAGDASARRDVEARMRALEPVWTQLVDRLVSLDRIADAVMRLEAGMRSQDAASRAAALDSRIDDLVGRAGGHELVTEELHRVGQEADAGRAPGDGYRDLVVREIEELTSRGE